MKNKSAAEDVMQQAMIAAFQNRTQLLEVDQIRGWIVCIAIRKSLDALRSTKRVTRLQRDLTSEGGASAGAAEETGTLELLASTEEKRALDGCLGQLEPELAVAVLMRYRDGMSWEQIAEVVELPVDTIRMRVQRGALKSLRECLAKKEITS